MSFTLDPITGPFAAWARVAGLPGWHVNPRSVVDALAIGEPRGRAVDALHKVPSFTVGPEWFLMAATVAATVVSVKAYDHRRELVQYYRLQRNSGLSSTPGPRAVRRHMLSLILFPWAVLAGVTLVGAVSQQVWPRFGWFALFPFLFTARQWWRYRGRAIPQ